MVIAARQEAGAQVFKCSNRILRVTVPLTYDNIPGVEKYAKLRLKNKKNKKMEDRNDIVIGSAFAIGDTFCCYLFS